MTRTCGKCEWYSRGLLRCKLGRVNLRTKKRTKEVIKIGGPDVVCIYSKWKMKAIEEIVTEKKKGL
jgi:hypothetical protein